MSDREHRPYTVPYTGSGARQQSSGFVPASSGVPPPVANPPAPQDAARAAQPAPNIAATRPRSPDPPSASASYKGSMAAMSGVTFSTSENDAVRRSTFPVLVPQTPFSDEIPARFRSASNATGTAIFPPQAAARGLVDGGREKATSDEKVSGDKAGNAAEVEKVQKPDEEADEMADEVGVNQNADGEDCEQNKSKGDCQDCPKAAACDKSVADGNIEF